MSFLVAAFLGLIQGLTEFLPISSSAHLRIFGELAGSSDPGSAFTAITQIGTETAVVIYFRRDIARIIGAWWRALRGKLPHSHPDARMGWYVAVGSLPIVILGVLLEDLIDTSLRNLWITATMLAVFAILLGAADRYSKLRHNLEDMRWGQALTFGFAQAMALIPGVSRSGGTITAGLAMGFTRVAAARYSFLLAIPAVMGSGFYKLFKAVGEPQAASPGMAATAVATLVAFASGYAVIVWFLKLVETRSYLLFVIYRLGLAIAVVALLTTGALHALA